MEIKSFPKYHIDIVLSILLIAALTLHFLIFSDKTFTSILIGVSILGFLPVVWGAYQSFRAKEWASMDLLASIALIFSLLSHQWVSAVFIELMLAAARILDDLTRDRTEKSIRGLLKLRPEIAQVEHAGTLVKTRLKDIKVGDIVVADIGERIPIDGIIVSGNAAIDESSLTGESLPVDKIEGNKVMSSTLVQSGSIRIKTTHTGKDTTLERVIQLVESARAEKPNSQTMGEKFGKVYLISIFVGSILLYVITGKLLLVLAVVLVICADDVAVAIPIAYLRAIRSAAAIGVIIKGGKHLEVFGTVRTIVFDKTGTLTTGKLVVSEIVTVNNHTEQEVTRALALAAIRSTHPLSRAIIQYANEHGYVQEFPDSAEEKGGKGIIAKKENNTIVIGKQIFLEELGVSFSPEILKVANERADLGKSISYIAINGEIVGFAAAADTPKKNAKTAISDLKMLGVQKIIMLTGDNEHTAQAVANDLGIDEWYANLLPEQKVEVVRKLEKENTVAMVGDGVNDAAALSIASVGIAMGGLGTEGAIESAEIVLMRDDLSTLPETMRLAQLARRVSVQDFWIWGATNVVGLLLVFSSVIGPAGAAAYNFVSDFLPLFNSTKVRAKKRKYSFKQ